VANVPKRTESPRFIGDNFKDPKAMLMAVGVFALVVGIALLWEGIFMLSQRFGPQS
jgi:hypothetical protein